MFPDLKPIKKEIKKKINPDIKTISNENQFYFLYVLNMRKNLV